MNATEVKLAHEIVSAIESRESRWEKVSWSEAMVRISFYQVARLTFVQAPLRQPAIQEKVLAFIDKRLLELCDRVMGDDFRQQVQAIVEKAEKSDEVSND